MVTSIIDRPKIDEQLARDVAEVRSMLATAFTFHEREQIETWAERSIVLTKQMGTRTPGKLSLDRFPYQRIFVQAWECPKYSFLWLVLAAQGGKTTVMQIILGYIIDQAPAPTMLVFVDINTAKRRSKKHLQQMIDNSPVLARHRTGRADDMKTLEYTLDGMTVDFAWAGSAASLAGEPERHVMMDEVDKWEHRDKDEAHPYHLARERMAAQGPDAKGIAVTTPNLEDSPSALAKPHTTQHEIFVPCPHCGKPKSLKDLPMLVTEKSQDQLKKRLESSGYQVLVWEGFTGWGKERDPDKCAKKAYYQCRYCKKPIREKHKHWMLEHAKAVGKHPDRSEFYCTTPRWYSPVYPWSKIVHDFFAAQGDPEALRNWTNATAAKVWKQQAVEKTDEDIKAHCVDYPADTVPFVPVFITMFVDVQQDEFYYVVRAWTEHEKSAQIRWGMLPRIGRVERDPDKDSERIHDSSFDVLNSVIDMTFSGPSGHEYPIDLVGIDCGYDQPNVFDFCRGRENVFPFKGEDNQKATLQYSRPETTVDAAGKRIASPDSVFLTTWKTMYYRDLWAAKMEIHNDDPGAWWLPKSIDDTYVRHMTSTQKIKQRNRKTGRVRMFWKEGAIDHGWDCEVGNIVMARVVGVRDMKIEETQEEPDPGDKSQDRASGNWVTMGR